MQETLWKIINKKNENLIFSEEKKFIPFNLWKQNEKKIDNNEKKNPLGNILSENENSLIWAYKLRDHAIRQCIKALFSLLRNSIILYIYPRVDRGRRSSVNHAMFLIYQDSQLLLPVNCSDYFQVTASHFAHQPCRFKINALYTEINKNET